MKNYFDKFISYESRHILIIIGSILLILAHLIHLVYKEYIIIFQILFIKTNNHLQRKDYVL